MTSVSKVSKAMVAILIVPLLFSLVTCGLLYVLLKPTIDLSLSVASMVIAENAPDFDADLGSIYQGKDLIERSTVPLAEVVIPFVGVHYANLSIQRIDLDVRLYWGDSEKILRYGAGQYIGSFLPGFQKPLLIGGHNLSVFKQLHYVTLDDEIIIHTNYGEYVYAVDEITVKKADDPTFYQLNQDVEQLILYTCYPFRILSGRRYDRFVVYGHRISGPDVK